MLHTLLILYFIAIMLSISLMDAVATLLFLHLAIKSCRTPSVFKKTGLEKIFSAWLLVVSLGFIINSAEGVPWIKKLLELKWMINCSISFWAISLYKPTEKIEKFAFWTILVFMVYAILISVLGYDPIRPGRTDLHPADFLGGVRTPGFLGNPMAFAHSTGIVFCFTFGLWLTQIPKNINFKQLLKENWLSSLVVILTAFAIICSFTRGVWFSISVAAILMTLLARSKFAITLLLGGFISVGSILFASHGFQERMKIAIDSKHETNQERVTLWKVNWEIFKEYPILGIGYGENFRRLPTYYKKMNIPENFFKSNAHNQFLHLLAGTGILGLAIYLLLLGILFYWNLKLWLFLPQENLFERGIILAYFGVLIHITLGGIFECNFEESVTLHAFFLITGVMLWIRHKNLLQLNEFKLRLKVRPNYR
jgi:O-antigen ligase